VAVLVLALLKGWGHFELCKAIVLGICDSLELEADLDTKYVKGRVKIDEGIERKEI